MMMSRERMPRRDSGSEFLDPARAAGTLIRIAAEAVISLARLHWIVWRIEREKRSRDKSHPLGGK